MVINLDDPLIPEFTDDTGEVKFDLTSDLEVTVLEFNEYKSPIFLPQPSPGDVVDRSINYLNYSVKEWYMTNESYIDAMIEKDNVFMPIMFNNNLNLIFKEPCVVTVKEIYFNNIRYKNLYLKTLEAMIDDPIYNSIKTKLINIRETVKASVHNIDIKFFIIAKIPLNKEEEVYEFLNLKIYVDWNANNFTDRKGKDKLKTLRKKVLDAYYVKLEYRSTNNENINVNLCNLEFELEPTSRSEKDEFILSILHGDNVIKKFREDKKDKLEINIGISTLNKTLDIDVVAKTYDDIENAFKKAISRYEDLKVDYNKLFSTERLMQIMTDVFKSNFSGNKATQSAIQADKEAIAKEKEEFARDKELIKTTKEALELLSPVPDF